jgi:hypothetical protein
MTDHDTTPTPPPTEPAESSDPGDALLAELGLLTLMRTDAMALRLLLVEAGLVG